MQQPEPQHFTTKDGLDLVYRTQGEGDPMVLVHGSWADHANWAFVAPTLARSFRVVTYDRRGHSDSQRPDTYHITDDAGDLAGLIEHLDIAPAHVVGNSRGAVVSLRLAGQSPDLFRSLNVHEPPAFGLIADDPDVASAWEEQERTFNAVTDRLAAGEYEDGARQFMDLIMQPGAFDALPPPFKDTFIKNAPMFLLEQQDPEVLNLDLDALANFDRPAMLTVGSENPFLFPQIFDRIAATLPGPTRHTFEGAGHVPHLTHAAPFAETITAFAKAAA